MEIVRRLCKVVLRITLYLKESETAQIEVLYSPDKIPTVPGVEVEYDKLTNREPIGEGGNADVMKATLPTADGDIALAIKEPRMHGTLHTDDIERLLKEAEIWSKLDSNDRLCLITSGQWITS